MPSVMNNELMPLSCMELMFAVNSAFVLLLLMATFSIGGFLLRGLILVLNLYISGFNEHLLYGADSYAFFLTFYLTLTPLYSRSRDFNLGRASIFLFKLQLSYIYICTSVSKLADPVWRSGQALYYFEILPLWLASFSSIEILGYLICYFVMISQILLAFLLWGRYRKQVFFLACIFHGVLAVLLNLYFFSALVVICLIIFLDTKANT